MLTELRCRSAKPKDKPYKIADARGLYLYVTPTGFKSWRWKYRFAGKEKRLTFGPFPEISLAQVRERRDSAARFLRDGVDPGENRKAQAAALIAESVNGFEAVARRWHDKQKVTWTAKHAAAVIESLEQEVFPTLGRKSVAKVTAPMVLAALQAIEDRGAIETAHRVRGRMSAVFVFAIASGLAESDPAAMVQKALRPMRKGRRPALCTAEEARALLAAVEADPAHPSTKLASRVLALTAVRPGIVQLAQPAEFEGLDGKAPIWRVPAAKMKQLLEQKEDDAFDFVIPLARQTVEAVRAAMRLIGPGPYLFPNIRFAHRPMSENAIGFMYNRQPRFRGRHVPHGWRSTFSTIMNEEAERAGRTGDRAIIDLMLAHKPPGVEGIYNRAAYMPRRREIVQEWADILLEGLSPAEDLLQGPRR